MAENLKLSASKQRKWNAKYLPEKWKKLHPQNVEVVVEHNMVGILCSIQIDRHPPENYNTFDSQQQQQRSGGKFNVP